MRTIRTNTNPRATDVAPQLQSVLNANGMQAHISMTETGTYQLVTMSHNSSQPRYYNINQKQLEALMNGGTTVWDKNAYNTFVSIVKNDYYIPGSFVAARNANSPVNMGLNGHRLNVGEYGYMGDPRFRPFSGPGLEDLTTQSSECCLEETGIMFAESTIDHSLPIVRQL